MLRDVYVAIVNAAGTALASTGLTVRKNPNDQQGRTAAGYVDLELIFGEELQLSRGGSTARFLQMGSLVATIYVPADTGIATAFGAADTLAEAMRGRVVTASTGESILFFGARPEPGGSQDGTADAFWQLGVVLPFEVTSSRAIA